MAFPGLWGRRGMTCCPALPMMVLSTAGPLAKDVRPRYLPVRGCTALWWSHMYAFGHSIILFREEEGSRLNSCCLSCHHQLRRTVVTLLSYYRFPLAENDVQSATSLCTPTTTAAI